MDRVLALLAPFAPLARPAFFGMERIPADRPLLFVGNHTLYGILDVPFLFERLYRDHGILLRSLGDHLHFKVPGWRELLVKFGVVHGNPENCAALMDAGECILVFPGGAREVARRKGEQNCLVWKNRVGFARMAIRHGCTIVPFSAVGVDDAFEILYDAHDITASRLGPWLELLGMREDLLAPIPRSFHPERLYFRIAEPIPTAHLEGRDDDETCWAIRREVQRSIEAGIDELVAHRAADPERRTGPIVRRRVMGAVRDAWDIVAAAARKRQPR
jgi:1-acyl-sn-glycerol-3-phosphate acyltransferase